MADNLSAEWSEREKLRERGQFWTPIWIARAMVAYVKQGSDLIFDPAAGKGVFYSALKELDGEEHGRMKYYGLELDPKIIAEANQERIFDPASCRIEIRDFITAPPQESFQAIVANPPYIRHHRLSPKMKEKFRMISKLALGRTLDGRAGLHVCFLIQALRHLQEGGRLAFIMPADTVEGVFAKPLWNWITANYRLEAVVTFAEGASPFPGVDTNPLIFLIRNRPPKATFCWARVFDPEPDSLMLLVTNGFAKSEAHSLKAQERNLREALKTGLSRPPQTGIEFEYHLSDFARVMRGIATGANEFFFLTHAQAQTMSLPKELLVPAIGRTRDVNGDTITKETLEALERKGRPTLLFSPTGKKFADFPASVQAYLRQGEELKLNERPLISLRQPWYKMETRVPPAFLFAYLGRRNARFIRNEAKVIPLTCLLCVYPHSQDPNSLDRLWNLLSHPAVIENLKLVGKSYGSGAIKVEPRSLEKLPLPKNLVEDSGLIKESPKNKSLFLFSQI